MVTRALKSTYFSLPCTRCEAYVLSEEGGLATNIPVPREPGLAASLPVTHFCSILRVGLGVEGEVYAESAP